MWCAEARPDPMNVAQLKAAGALEDTGSGTPVVMVHGIGGTLSVFEAQVQALGGTMRTIRYDLRGSGRHRAAQAMGVQDWVADLVALLDELGCARIHGVGHSLGTLVLQELAARHPARVASLALLGINRGPSEERRAAMRERARQVASGGIGPMINTLMQAGPSAHTRANAPLTMGLLREMLLAQDPQAYAWTCEAMAAASRPQLQAWDGPLLLVAGADDKASPPEISQALAAERPGTRIVVLPECGHWMPIERPAEVARELRAFLAAAA